MNEESDTTLIVDGQNLFMRAVFAAQSGSPMSSHGVATGPLLIFINGLAKHVQQEQPSRLVVCWDGGTSAERVALVPSYKANRRPVPADDAEFRDTTHDLVRRFLVLANVHQQQTRGVEADDLVAGAWAGITPHAASKIVILSSDKDFLQLTGDNPHGVPTELVRLSSAGTQTDRWDAERVTLDLGFRPKNWPLITALAGDKGDGVPGLPGVGPVKARKLLEAAEWDLEALALSPEKIKLVQSYHDVVNLRSGAHIRPTVPPPWRPTRADGVLWVDLINFLSSYELLSVKDRLHTNQLWGVDQVT